MAPVSVSADPFLPTASFVREEDEHPKDRFSNEVPVVSLDGIDGAQRAEIRDRVAAACEDWGIFQVVDHGVDAALVADMARLARDFFALPPEDKLRFDMSGGGGKKKKGGFVVNRHLQAGEVAQDWRELVIFFSYPVKSRDYSRWPDKPAAWRAVVERYSEQLTGLACKLLGMLSEAMGVETDALAKACVDMEQKVVINFCPECPRPDLKLGIKRHTDPGTMELLLQDLGGGLQATRDGGQTWTTVQPVEGAFLVSLGDHAHLLSNGRFKNAEHQAVVKLNSDRSRLSIATLQSPAPDVMVYPLAVRDGEAPILDKPITFAEMYRRNKVRNMELAKLKKQAKPEKKSAMEFAAPALNAPNGKPLDDILA